jgi:hypothetical protein
MTTRRTAVARRAWTLRRPVRTSGLSAFPRSVAEIALNYDQGGAATRRRWPRRQRRALPRKARPAHAGPHARKGTQSRMAQASYRPGAGHSRLPHSRLSRLRMPASRHLRTSLRDRLRGPWTHRPLPWSRHLRGGRAGLAGRSANPVRLADRAAGSGQQPGGPGKLGVPMGFPGPSPVKVGRAAYVAVPATGTMVSALLTFYRTRSSAPWSRASALRPSVEPRPDPRRLDDFDVRVMGARLARLSAARSSDAVRPRAPGLPLLDHALCAPNPCWRWGAL